MRLRRRHREHAEVATESLNDIMFMLLLFFLIVSTLVNPNVIKLLLPDSKQQVEVTKVPILLQVTSDKQYYIDKNPIPVADLKGALIDATTGLDKPTIVLRLDKSLTMQDLVDVLQVGTEIKVKMVLATKNAGS